MNQPYIFVLCGYSKDSTFVQIEHDLPDLKMEEMFRIMNIVDEDYLYQVLDVPPEKVAILSNRFGFEDRSDIYQYQLECCDPTPNNGEWVFDPSRARPGKTTDV